MNYLRLVSFFVMSISASSLYAYGQAAYMTMAMPLIETQQTQAQQMQAVPAMKMAVAVKRAVIRPFLLENEKSLEDQEYINKLLEQLPQEYKDKFDEIKRILTAEPREDFKDGRILLRVPYEVNKLDTAKAIAQDLGMPFFCVNGAYFAESDDKSTLAAIFNDIIPLLKTHDRIVLIINWIDVVKYYSDRDYCEFMKFFDLLGNKHVLTLVTTRPFITIENLIQKGLLTSDYQNKNISESERLKLSCYVLQDEIEAGFISKELVFYLMQRTENFFYDNFVKLVLDIHRYLNCKGIDKINADNIRQFIRKHEYKSVETVESVVIRTSAKIEENSESALAKPLFIAMLSVCAGWIGLVLVCKAINQKNKTSDIHNEKVPA